MTLLQSAPLEYEGVPVPETLRTFWDTPIGRWWRQGVDDKAATLPFEVKPGQIFADNDPRSEGRTLRVDEIENGVALCTILTNRHITEYWLRQEDSWVKDQIGHRTRIKVRRLYPNARGYRLIEDVKE